MIATVVRHLKFHIIMKLIFWVPLWHLVLYAQHLMHMYVVVALNWVSRVGACRGNSSCSGIIDFPFLMTDS